MLHNRDHIKDGLYHTQFGRTIRIALGIDSIVV